MVKEIDTQVLETQSHKYDEPKEVHTKTKCIIKDKERILKAAREKQLVTYKGVTIRLSADFSTETL